MEYMEAQMQRFYDADQAAMQERFEALSLRNPYIDLNVPTRDIAALIEPAEFVLINGAIALSQRVFGMLYEYSRSLPTGTTTGKVWKRKTWDGDWYLGRYGDKYPAGHQHAGQIAIGWWPILIRGQEPRFPRNVRIARPSMRGRVTAIDWPPAPPPPMLPDGVWEIDGVLVCECRGCDRTMPIDCEPEDFHSGGAYCGGSPRCLP